MVEVNTWDQAEEETPFMGVRTRRVDQGNLTLIRYSMEPKIEYPAHRHPGEQTLLISEGNCELETKHRVLSLSPGDIAFTPSMETHRITAGKMGVVFVALINPRRDESSVEFLT